MSDDDKKKIPIASADLEARLLAALLDLEVASAQVKTEPTVATVANFADSIGEVVVCGLRAFADRLHELEAKIVDAKRTN